MTELEIYSVTLLFEKANKSWRAVVGGVAVFVDDENGAPHAMQRAIAERLGATLDDVRIQAAHYLDMFVDRARACGNANEAWWLDEIELRDMSLQRPRCRLSLTLEGDDGGQWTVEMIAEADHFFPIRFERLQR